MTTAAQFTELLQLTRPPVAVRFQDDVPAGVPRIDRVAPSGCSFWKYAAEGQTFYTQASDHYGCPVGSYTHGIDLPPEKAKELEGLMGTMIQLQYLDPSEIPGIPHRSEPFAYAIYAPLEQAAFEPDVILVSGNAQQTMLLAEAAHAAGVSCDTSMVGRPTCAAIPAVIQSQRTATNLGCIGNRVYTGLDQNDLYFVIAGPQFKLVADKLSTIIHANRELEKFHRGRVA